MKALKKRRRLIFIGLAVAAAAIVGFVSLRKPAKAKDPQDETATVEKRVVENVIEVSGHLKAKDEQEIRAPAAGIVESVFARAGERVKPGTPIARMDTTEAQYELDKLGYQIEQERFSGNRRKIELLERELAVRRRVLSDLTLSAHINGFISRLDLKQGDVLKNGESYGRVIDVSALVADVEIGETDIPRAKVGQPVEFRFPALPGLVSKGRVVSFPAEARINQRGLVVLDAKLIIDAPPSQLLPAYSFNAVIKAGESREVLIVDSRAVSYKQGKPYVERSSKDGGWEKVDVETEGFGSGLIRIVTGCAEGDLLRIAKASPQERQ